MSMTATLTKGDVGYFIQDSIFCDNNPDSDYPGDWTWHIGCWAEYYNDKAFGAGCIPYTIPSISGVIIDGVVTIPTVFSSKMNESTAEACLSTTAPEDLSWRHGPTTGIISDEIDIAYTDKTITFKLNSGVNISGKTIYLYLYQRSTDFNDLNALVTDGGIDNATLTYTASGTASIDEGTRWGQYIPYVDHGTNWEVYNV